MKVDRQLRDISLPRKKYYSCADLTMHLALNAFGKSVLSVIIVLLFCQQAIFSILFWFADWKPDTYIYANAFTNMFPPGFLICIEIYLRCKFSGVPYTSDESRSRVRRVNLILIFWGVCQGLTGGVKFFEEDKEAQIFDAILGTKKDGNLFEKLLGPIIFVSQLFFLEVLPLILITDSKTAENFLIKQEIEEELNRQYHGLDISLMENESEKDSVKIFLVFLNKS
jgi:hypothetical protein